MALAFSFFAKGFSGSYLKSMITQIERRFEISSSIVGLIDGSFEIGMCISLHYAGKNVCLKLLSRALLRNSLTLQET